MRNLNEPLVKCTIIGGTIEVSSPYYKESPAVKDTILRYYVNEIKKIIKTK
jgi:hypothetical protein